MKKYIFLLILIIPSLVNAGGPSVPDGYRMPNGEELSLPFRDSDKYQFSVASGDFNGDGFVDGACLAVDLNKKELAIFVFLYTNIDQTFKWFKLESLEYQSVKFTGVKKIAPGTVTYYSDVRGEQKLEKELRYESFELFQHEGSSSIFYYDPELKYFKRVWISK